MLNGTVFGALHEIYSGEATYGEVCPAGCNAGIVYREGNTHLHSDDCTTCKGSGWVYVGDSK